MHRLICPTHFFSASFSLRKTSLLYLIIFVTPECLLVLFSENNWMHFSHLNINEYFPSKLPPNTLHPAYQVLHQSSRIPISYLLFPPIISISSVPSLKCSFRGAVFVSPPPGHFYCSLQWPWNSPLLLFEKKILATFSKSNKYSGGNARQPFLTGHGYANEACYHALRVFRDKPTGKQKIPARQRVI